jgi:hypothetical protein
LRGARGFSTKGKSHDKGHPINADLAFALPTSTARVTDNCEFRLKAFAFGPTGEPKGKCMMGDNADCDRCGCVVPFHMATLSNRRLMIKETIKRFRAPKRPVAPPRSQSVEITARAQ